MIRLLSTGLALAVLSTGLVTADEPAKKPDPAKLEELKQKLQNVDPAKLEELKQKFQNLDPAKIQELKDKFGKGKGKGGADKVDPEALFKKYADKEGKLSLDDFKKLYAELKEKQGPGGPGGRFGNFDPAKLQELKDKFKNKQQQ